MELIISISKSHTQYHCTTEQIKPSNHTLNLLKLTPNYSPTTNFPWLYPTDNWIPEPEPYITTDDQSASLSWNKAPIWGLRSDLSDCQTVAGLLMWGALSDGRTGVAYNCCWSSRAQSFLGPSPVELMTIIYCLRFETSLFVTSYDSQGYGGGIRHRLHKGRTEFQSKS
jgi:hypothetical protein